MKTLICCIVKMENLYLRDFVEYYKNLGATNIVLYDNNDEHGEYPQQVIGDYIRDGFVIYKDVRGKHRYQLKAYTECYDEYKTQFDWIGFIDVDEYLEILDGSRLNDWLGRLDEQGADAVAVFWLIYGDNGKTHYENKPVYDRFLIPNPPGEVNTFKFFVKGNEYVDAVFTDANAFFFTITNKDGYNVVNAVGETVHLNNIYREWSYEGAYLKHYQTLTIDEFLCRRFGRRSYADENSDFSYEKVIGIFPSACEMTPEKQQIIDDFFKTYEMKEDLLCDQNFQH